MNQIISRVATKGGGASIGQAAARRRDQLSKLKESDRLRQEASRSERERLGREIAELEAQARRIERQKHLKEKQRVCFVLGEIVLEAMLENGGADLHGVELDFSGLKPEMQALLEAVVCRLGSAQPAMLLTDGNDADPGSTQELDILI